MVRKFPTSVLRYSIAVAAVALALFLTLLLQPYLERSTFALLFAAVIVSSWSGGLGPGLLATALFALSSIYLFLSPHYAPAATKTEDILELILSILVAALISSLTAARRRAEEGLRQAHEELDRQGEERTAALSHVNAALQQEISERQRTGEALRESEARFRALANAIPSMVWIAAPDGTITFANDQWFSYCGLTPEQNARGWSALVLHPDDQERCLTQWLQALEHGTAYEIEVRNRRYDGEYRWFLTRAVPTRDAEGRITAWFATTTDIHDRKLAEAALQKAHEELELRVQERTAELVQTNAALQAEITERQRMEAKLRESERLAAIGTTAAKLAHEIGNPLNGMYTTVQLLERHLAKQQAPVDETLQATVHDLTSEITRLRTLLEEIRSFSRRPQLSLEPLDLATVAAEVLAVAAPHYTAQGIRVEQMFPPELPLVIADREKLKQVLLNLYKNAAEAMPKGGTLTVRACHAGEQVWLEVQDTGGGIPEGVDIFVPFTTTKPEGTGLGLAIVRQIVLAHGGTITYISTPGQGTTFTLSLPVPLPERAESTPEQPALRATG
jgi:PAS domain S-box-containing protein